MSVKNAGASSRRSIDNKGSVAQALSSVNSDFQNIRSCFSLFDHTGSHSSLIDARLAAATVSFMKELLPSSEGHSYLGSAEVPVGFPIISATVDDVRSTSSRRAAGLSFVNWGWLHVWLPISCPSAAMRRTISGYAAAFWPIRKNVALIPLVLRISRSRGVRVG